MQHVIDLKEEKIRKDTDIPYIFMIYKYRILKCNKNNPQKRDTICGCERKYMNALNSMKQ